VAAQAKFDAAAPDRADRLLATAETAALDDLQRARADVLRAQIAFARGRGSDAPPLLLKAAKYLEPLDGGLAREGYLEAFGAVLFAGRLSGTVGVREVTDAARAAGRAGCSGQSPRGLDLLLDGLVTRLMRSPRPPATHTSTTPPCCSLASAATRPTHWR